MKKREAVLKLVEDLRARGARMVRLHPDGSVAEIIFSDGPLPKPGEPLDPQAEHEYRQRKAKEMAEKRDLDARLFDPLGIGKGKAA